MYILNVLLVISDTLAFPDMLKKAVNSEHYEGDSYFL